MRVAIVGGGISGLATAFYVGRDRPDWEISVYEAASRWGGTMQTADRDGFLFECGPNGFLSNRCETLELIRDAGAEDLLQRSSDAARRRFIYADRLHPLPESPVAFLGTRLLSWRGKLRVLGELFVPARRDNEDESLQQFGERRVGKEFTDVFLNAMSAGIFASTPPLLSVAAAFPKVVALERDHGGLFRGMIARRKKEAGPGGVLMSFHGGVSRFIEHLAGRISGELRTDCPVHSVTREGERYRLDSDAGTQEFDQVVLATPAYVTRRLVADLDPRLAELVGEIDYAPISIVGFGYRNLAHPLDGFGLLTTSGAGQEILGVLWDSVIFPDRAPAGAKSLRVMIGGLRQPELALCDDSDLVEIAQRGVAETMGVTDDPDVTFVQRWERGIPSYAVGHLERITRMDDRLAAHPGLHLNGNAYRGVGINDCVENSRRCAGLVAQTRIPAVTAASEK